MKLISSNKQLKSPLVWLEIDAEKVESNIKSIRNLVLDKKIMAVVKANAYGVGAVEIAKVIESYVDSFGVVGIAEGKKLRNAGIKKPIINLGIYNPDDADELTKNNITPTLFTETNLKNYEVKIKNKQNIWIKVDTGLGRLGVPYKNALDFIKTCSESKQINISGIYSSLTEDASFDEIQLNRFINIKKQYEKKYTKKLIWSISSSAATFISKKYYLDMVRIGIPLAGFYPSKEAKEATDVQLKPAVSYKTRVACIKELEKDESIFYRKTFVAKQKTRIAILLPGYSYGLDPRLANRNQVLIQGKKYPLIGGISATNCFVDIWMNKKIDVGDEVVIFGQQNNLEIKLDELCDTLSQNVYEILSRIPEKVTKIYKPS
ncbi:alanine racemase [Candidatus Parcubacteria bacterium]|nr:MAG: alanine racemase [Candidatus Parcubacteria bacterium]